jgi:hypothetical protein
MTFKPSQVLKNGDKYDRTPHTTKISIGTTSANTYFSRLRSSIIFVTIFEHLAWLKCHKSYSKLLLDGLKNQIKYKNEETPPAYGVV